MSQWGNRASLVVKIAVDQGFYIAQTRFESMNGS